jgi:uncharacterized membrane protein/thiol-disulfide isomerase/thioredoxin
MKKQNANKPKIFKLALLLLIVNLISPVFPAKAQDTVVNAVLFYSPSCPHCHTVIDEHLPPLLEKYGTQLNIVGINVAIQQGQELYQSAVKRFSIPEEMLGVPCLIVGETVLVGSIDIPEKFPGIIEDGLSQGGIAMPDIPGLQEALAGNQETSQNTANNEQSQAGSSSEGENTQVDSQIAESNSSNQNSSGEQSQNNINIEQLSVIDKFRSDLTGNLLSVFVLIGMIASVIGVSINYSRNSRSAIVSWPDWVIPLLAIVGMVVSVYMSYVEITQTEALCGPVGNCNAVQQSPYAQLFGVLPVGVLGMIGYVLIALVWLLQKLGGERWRNILTLVLWGMALIGILFSIYLTFLEPFVIGATCAWCITSAIVITLIFLTASTPAKLAWREISKHN